MSEKTYKKKSDWTDVSDASFSVPKGYILYNYIGSKKALVLFTPLGGVLYISR